MVGEGRAPLRQYLLGMGEQTVHRCPQRRELRTQRPFFLQIALF
jgi:hypothetical protein